MLLALPAAARLGDAGSPPEGMRQGQGGGEEVTRRTREGDLGQGGSGIFSAPEIEVALLSSALLVVAGASLILRDRHRRRRG